MRVVFDVRKKRNIAIGLHRRKEVRMSLENVRINVGASDPYEGPYVVTRSRIIRNVSCTRFGG